MRTRWAASGPIGYHAVEGKAARYCEATDGILEDWPGNGVRAHLDDRARGSLSSPAHRSIVRYACPSARTIDVNRVTPRLQLGDMQLVSAGVFSTDSQR